MDVLGCFLENPRLNLIFAPHVILFRRFLRHRATLPGRFHAEFLSRQRAAFAYTFYRDPERTAAQVGADAIAGFLESPGPRA